MNECEKYWFRINKRHLIADCCGAALFTVFGGGRLIAVIFYMIAVEVCGMNYLMTLHFSGNDNDALNLAKTLPVERSMFYDVYIKMMLLQTAAFTVIYALGTAIGSVSGIMLPLLPRAIFKDGTIVSNIGYYTLLMALVIIVLVVMTGFTEKCSIIARSMLPIGTIYIAMIYQPFYLLLLELAKPAPRFLPVYSLFVILGGVALCVMTAVFVGEVKTNRAKFVTK